MKALIMLKAVYSIQDLQMLTSFTGSYCLAERFFSNVLQYFFYYLHNICIHIEISVVFSLKKIYYLTENKNI